MLETSGLLAAPAGVGSHGAAHPTCVGLMKMPWKAEPWITFSSTASNGVREVQPGASTHKPWPAEFDSTLFTTLFDGFRTSTSAGVVTAALPASLVPRTRLLLSEEPTQNSSTAIAVPRAAKSTFPSTPTDCALEIAIPPPRLKLITLDEIITFRLGNLIPRSRTAALSDEAGWSNSTLLITLESLYPSSTVIPALVSVNSNWGFSMIRIGPRVAGVVVVMTMFRNSSATSSL